MPEEIGGHLVDFLLTPLAGASSAPFGRIVPSLASGSPPAGIPEQQVSRAGLRLQRIAYRTRWVDGSTYVWFARRRLLGARGPASGLVYDRVLPPST